MKRIVCYLKGTVSHGITYSKSGSNIEAIGYADADWAEGHDQKLISGYIFIMSGGVVVWSAKKQGTIALSTLEAEYTMVSHATQLSENPLS